MFIKCLQGERMNGRCFGYQIAALVTKGISLRCSVSTEGQAACPHGACDDINGAAPLRDLEQLGF